jgi:cell division protein FtsZ
MTLNLTVSPQLHTDFSPRITVIGVGGGGTNAVDNMIAMNLQGVEFVVANTDAQQLVHSRADRRIQLGPHITQGLGAGAKPEIGRAAAEEAADELYRHLEGAHMAFITAGMGGGTGTGAAPVIAKMARERGILTVGVVTKPFTFEGSRRARAAEEGIAELTQYVDTLIVIPNQNLFRLANERTGWKEAFKMADNVLYMGVRGVTDLMMAPGMVNLDFADIRTVMAEMGKAMMGTGEAEGENRAIRAAEAAISNPLLEDTCMAGARGLLINITGGEDMTLFEVDQAANRVREEVDEDANIIFGSAIDVNLNGKVRVSVVATGIESAEQKLAERPRLVAVGGQPAVAVAAAAAPAATGPIAATMRAAAAPGQPGIAQPMMPQAGPGMAAASQRMAQPRPMLHTTSQPAAAPAARFTPSAAPATAPMVGAAPEPAETAAPQGYDMELDEPPAAPRQIPPHLQQPLRPLGAVAGQRPRTAPRPGSGLFADPPRAEQAPQPPRRSLFGIVTGAIRSSLPSAPPADAPSHGEPPHGGPAPHEEPEPVRANVRPAVGEEMGIDIPAFLRRQSS